MSGLMDLPLEIRIMIYKYCLVVNEPIDAYATISPLSSAILDYRRKLPAVALLRVNKTIETEAAGILYGKNVWCITPRKRCDLNWRDQALWGRRAPLFRHVLINFERSEYKLLFPRAVREYERDEPPQDELMRILHNIAKDPLDDGWVTRLAILWQMRNLVSVVLNIEKLFCFTGCCRRSMLESVLGILKHRRGMSITEGRKQHDDCYNELKKLYCTYPPPSPSEKWSIWPPFKIIVKGLGDPIEMAIVREYGFLADGTWETERSEP